MLLPRIKCGWRWPLGLALAAVLLARVRAADGFNVEAFDQEQLSFGATVAGWTLPAYPAELAAHRAEGDAHVRFLVDRTGWVVQAWLMAAFDPRAGEAALQTVRRWRFRPALFAGQPTDCCMEVRVEFRLKNLAKKKRAQNPVPAQEELPHVVRTQDPVAVDRPDPLYAPDLLARFSGERIAVEVELDAHGAVTAAQVLQAPDPALVAPTLAAMKRWKFEPARQGPLAVPCFHQATIVLESAASTTIAAPPLAGQDASVLKP